MEEKTKSTKSDDAQYQMEVRGLHEFVLTDFPVTNSPVLVPSFAAVLKWADNNQRMHKLTHLYCAAEKS